MRKRFQHPVPIIENSSGTAIRIGRLGGNRGAEMGNG
jgi:hypothetical protein